MLCKLDIWQHTKVGITLRVALLILTGVKPCLLNPVCCICRWSGLFVLIWRCGTGEYDLNGTGVSLDDWLNGMEQTEAYFKNWSQPTRLQAKVFLLRPLWTNNYTNWSCERHENHETLFLPSDWFDLNPYLVVYRAGCYDYGGDRGSTDNSVRYWKDWVNYLITRVQVSA